MHRCLLKEDLCLLWHFCLILFANFFPAKITRNAIFNFLDNIRGIMSESEWLIPWLKFFNYWLMESLCDYFHVDVPSCIILARMRRYKEELFPYIRGIGWCTSGMLLDVVVKVYKRERWRDRNGCGSRCQVLLIGRSSRDYTCFALKSLIHLSDRLTVLMSRKSLQKISADK